MTKKRKKSKGAVCSMIRKSSAKAIKKAPVEGREAVVAEIERQRDEQLEKHECQ